MELIAGDARLIAFAEIADRTDQAADAVVILHRLADRGVRDVDAVLLLQRLEDVVLALQHSEIHVVLGVLEGDLHVFVEEVRIVLAHRVQQLHVLHGAVHHGTAVRRDDAVGKVEAALDSALEQRTARLTQEVRHIIGGDVDRPGVRRGQADRNRPIEIQQRLRHVLAGVGNADFSVRFCLLNESVVGLLQKILEILQVFQISHCVAYSPILIKIADALRPAARIRLFSADYTL